jgi:hypothetical protein
MKKLAVLARMLSVVQNAKGKKKERKNVEKSKKKTTNVSRQKNCSRYGFLFIYSLLGTQVSLFEAERTGCRARNDLSGGLPALVRYADILKGAGIRQALRNMDVILPMLGQS